MDKTVLGLFDSFEDADGAYDEFISLDYTANDISVITQEETAKHMLDAERDVAEGMTQAATVGGVIGGLLGLITGLGALTVPGLGALFIVGPLAAAFGLVGTAAATASGAITGVLAGGLVGAFKELGLDEINAKVIEDKVKAGYTLLAVKCRNNDETQIRDLLSKYNAENITTINLK